MPAGGNFNLLFNSPRVDRDEDKRKRRRSGRPRHGERSHSPDHSRHQDHSPPSRLYSFDMYHGGELEETRHWGASHSSCPGQGSTYKPHYTSQHEEVRMMSAPSFSSCSLPAHTSKASSASSMSSADTLCLGTRAFTSASRVILCLLLPTPM